MALQNRQHPIELVGEVRAVALNDDADGGGVFRLRLEDGTTVEVDFSAEYEASIAVSLLESKSHRVKITGLGDFGPDGQLRRVCRLDTKMPEWLFKRRPTPDAPDAPASARDFMQRWVEFGKSIPEEELAKFPTDFAENMDHYLYGSPKRSEE